MVKNFLVLSLLVLAPLAFASTPISECGYFYGGEYHLTQDLQLNIPIELACLRFNFNDTIIDCQGHSVRTMSPQTSFQASIDSFNSQSITVKNCDLIGAVGINVVSNTPASIKTLVKVENTEILAGRYGIKGNAWINNSEVKTTKITLMNTTPNAKHFWVQDVGHLKVIDSEYNDAFVEIKDIQNTTVVKRSYSINVNFVDSVTLAPVRTVITYTNALGRGKTFTTSSNGVWNDLVQTSEKSRFYYQNYNPFAVSINGMVNGVVGCYSPVTNNNYVLNAPVAITMKLVKIC